MEKYYGKTIVVEKAYDFIPEFTFFNYYANKDFEFEHYAELKQCLIDDEERFKRQMMNILPNISSKCSLILCDRLEEIERFENFFNWNHWSLVSMTSNDKYTLIKITGQTKVEDDNKQLADALKQNKPIIIIWSIQKTATWFDYTIIETVFIFSSIKFENTVIQSIGRALRKHPWKTWANIFTWNDLPILNKQKLQKQSAIKKEYWNPKITMMDINKKRKQKSTITLTF